MGNHYYLSLLLLSFAPAATFAQERVSDDLVTLYTFREGSGEFIQDVSGFQNPLLMKIHDPSTVNWIDGGGIQIDSPSLIKTLSNANKIGTACQLSGEITMEMWVIPENTTQDGPCRMMSVSNGINDRNFMLGQKNSRYISRVRTSTTGNNGTPNLETSSSSVTPQLQHIVYTLSNSGNEKIYVNGQLAVSGTRTGNFNNWNLNYELLLANETSQDRPWLGEIYLAAIYSRALSNIEVTQNFNAGHLQPGTTLSDALCEAEQCFVDGFGANQRILWLPNLPFPVGIDYKFDATGGTFDIYPDGTAHIYGATWNLDNPDYGWYVDVWLTDKMSWNEWSALGRGWKGNPSVVGNLYTTWNYYILDPEKENALIGLGLFEGSTLPVTHKPVNYYYGFQVGMAANDQNNMPGMSCWLDYSGEIDGDYFEGNCDLNMEGECTQLPVLECALDIVVSCEDGWNPEITGTPVLNCEDEFTLTYSDNVIGNECPVIIERTWTATNSLGVEVICVQTITVTDESAPTILPFNTIWQNCELAMDWNINAVDNCDDQVDINIEIVDSTWTSLDNCDLGMFRTQTQGGWGTNPNGNNPGVYLDQYFDQVFPDGLSIGCFHQLELTSAQAVRDFLPSGSSPSELPGGVLTDPGLSYNNVLAGQLVAATLNVAFDMNDTEFGDSPIALGTLEIMSGTFSGFTINDLLIIANEVIGGCSSSHTPAEVNEALSLLNENFTDGTVNNGFLDCSLPFDCYLLLSTNITATDDCGNQTSTSATILIGDNTPPSFESLPESIDVECNEIPSAEIELQNDCFGESMIADFEEIEFSGACLPTIMRTWTAADQCGNTSTFTQFIHVEDNTSPTFLNTPTDLFLQCGVEIPMFVPDVTDNCNTPVQIVMTESTSNDGCFQLITRTWTATDACQNSSSVSQQISISDNEAPTSQDFDSELTFNCGDIPPATDMIFEDNCSLVTLVSFAETTIGTECDQEITRTWVVMDWCGNEATFVQHIFASDEEAPTAQNIPNDVILPCGSELPSTSPYFFDNCSEVQIVYNEVPVSNPGWCDGLTRMWIATDNCGNSTIITQDVQFTDNNPPSLNGVPSNITVGCGEIPSPANVSATDNCDINVEVTLTESVQQSGCDGMLTRTWVAVDECGNTSISSQTITVTDQSAPEFSAIAEITIDCSQFALLDIEATDDCLGEPEVTFIDVISGSGCEYTVQRTWTAVDACGNDASFLQIIHVTDGTGPIFSSIPPDINLGCGVTPFYEEPIVADNCDYQIQLEYSEMISGSGCEIQYFRTWIATDNCGNSTTAHQIISSVDNVPPVIHNVPQDLNYNCENYVYSDSPGNVYATDNCDTDPELQFTELEVPGNCPNEFQIIRTWTATDDCGNVSTEQQFITVVDNTPPVISGVPGDIEVDCSDIPAVPIISASDNCPGEISISLEETIDSGGCPIIQRTWTATDACGNSASAVQFIYMVDEIPPSITGVPPSGDASCNSIPPIPDPMVSDNCDQNIDISFNESIVGSGCEYLIIRTWVAEDDCGNTSVISQSITIQDEAPPVFVNPLPEVTISCENLDTYPGPQVMDDCGSFVNLMYEDVIDGEGCNHDILRTYTAFDLCGNSASFTQIIHVEDNNGPAISGVPYSTFVDCNNIPPVPNVTATDVCNGNAVLNFNESIVGSGCNYEIHRSWTAEDNCGNVSTAQQIIYVSDNSAPILINVPENLQMGCNDLIPPPANVVATDECSANGGEVSISFLETEQFTACGSTITRTWLAIDECGNTDQTSQIIEIIDDEAPVFDNIPVDVFTTCDSIPEIIWPTATDNCGSDFTITFSENLIPGGCPYQLVRTWTATDNCGNTSIATQQIFIEDNEFPVLTGVPANIEVECGNVPVAPEVIGTDNCSQTLTVFMDENFFEGGCYDAIQRVWKTTDLCGNQTIAIQIITIIDTQAPTFDMDPADLIVECSEVPEVPEVQADDCNNFILKYDEVIRPGICENEYTVMRIWSASDVCGNETSMAQSVTIFDNTAPILSAFPPDMTVDCNDVPPVEEITATDNCSDNPEVTFTEEIIYLNNNDSTCVLTNSVTTTGELVVWLPYLAGFGPAYVFGEAGGTLEQNPSEGTAHLTGQIYNLDNANLSFIIDIYLREKRNWDEWNALGRSYKDDAGFAGDEFINWSYYEMDESSQLIGAGDFEGSTLALSHAPSSFYYGFQLGWGANNLNAAYGMSGWFFYSGTLNGSPVYGVGDVMTENSCCPDQQIIRHWEVSDCAGNIDSHTQNIYVSSQTEPFALNYPDPEQMNRLDLTTTSDEEFRIRFYLRSEGQTVLEIFDINGQMLSQVYEGNVLANTEYTITYPVDKLASGNYLVRLRQDRMQLTERGVVVH